MTPHTYLDQGLAIFRTRLKAPGGETHVPFGGPARPFITISRENCAGATTLGRLLLPRLDEQFGDEERSWMFLDKDLLTHALTQHHLPEHLATYLPEDRVSEIKGMIGEIVGLHPPLWELEHRVSEAILQIALLGHVIFAGRASHLITRGVPGGLHLRLVAPMEVRVQRLQAMQGCDRATAIRTLEETDRARSRYVHSNFEANIDDPHAYDLMINTAHFAPEAMARLVLQVMHERVGAAAGPPPV
ncbi:MAG TPA: cytidylate kinase-like family protein [Lacunisphaera sp.]|jgi:cytidylate kinase|nr:cytidylate kinase-like family protein [Lacunisphaera sp.]